MKTFQSITLALLFWMIGGACQAAVVLATGGVYGGPAQRKAYCYVFNASAHKPVYVSEAQLIKQDGSVVAIPWSSSSCQPLDPSAPKRLRTGRTCLIAAEIASNATYSCRAIIDGATAEARGTLDIRDGTEKVLASSPLR
jgi:hypothetical protein